MSVKDQFTLTVTIQPDEDLGISIEGFKNQIALHLQEFNQYWKAHFKAGFVFDIEEVAPEG